MKHTITMLLLAACFTSCKKETPIIFTDFEINKQIDERIFANAWAMSKSEIEAIALEKEIVIKRIKKNNPGIKFQDLYPKEALVLTANKQICVDTYVSTMTSCKIAFYASTFFSKALGVGISCISTPFVGGGVAAGCTTVSIANFVVCSSNAAAFYKACQSAN